MEEIIEFITLSKKNYRHKDGTIQRGITIILDGVERIIVEKSKVKY